MQKIEFIALLLCFCCALQSFHRSGNVVTFYKEITPVCTAMELEVATKQIPELDIDYDFYVTLQPEWIFTTNIEQNPFLAKFRSLLQKLKDNGFIGDDPLRHWIKNQVLCKIEIINPDLTIQDKPLKHVTPLMQEQFTRHIEGLLQLKVIRPSKSRHRTMAMIVNSGTTVDPLTGKEVKGKERMVFNYRSLNDNTYKDQYSLPVCFDTKGGIVHRLCMARGHKELMPKK